jgi:opacity protein-like surface antigen
MKKLLVGTVMALVASTAAQAADKDGNFQILGAGVLTCQKYLDSSIEDHRNVEIWWAGYVSAMNRSTADTWGLTGDKAPADVNKMIDAECGSHPNELLGIAVHDVLEALYKTRIQDSPKK